MAKLRLRYVNVVHKGDRTYYYFRRAGSKRMSLPGLPGSTQFMEAYQTAFSNASETMIDIGASRTTPGTINAIIVAFYKHYRFNKNKPITQQTDRNILEALRAQHGEKRVALLEQRHIEAMIYEKAGKPFAQRNLLRVLRVLLGFAVSQNMRRENPALGIKLATIKTSGYHSWTEDETPIRGAPSDRH
jgi:hypothetical protein